MKPAPRLYCQERLTAASEIALTREQSHYLVTVLRLGPGDPIALFNGEDGEWLCYLSSASRKGATAVCERAVSAATPPPDIDFVFAPLKHVRLDYLIQKAVELGARRLCPVLTARTVAERVNLERMRANAIEAAEQCNQVYVPEIKEPQSFNRLLADWESARILIHCDETASVADPVLTLQKYQTPSAVLIGPEGGFTNEERLQLAGCAFVRSISLGPRIMRADTAGLAVLALVQATVGDWRLRQSP